MYIFARTFFFRTWLRLQRLLTAKASALYLIARGKWTRNDKNPPCGSPMLNFLRSFWRIKRPLTMEPLIAVVGATGTGKSKIACSGFSYPF
jgi:hypothetical protein